MKRLGAALGVLAVLALSMGFAALNGGQRVTVRLGFATFYGVPLTFVAFGALVVGMAIMLAASIRSDLKVRRILREALAREDEKERGRLFVDGAQRDLFDPPGAPGASPPPAPPAPSVSPRPSRPHLRAPLSRTSDSPPEEGADDPARPAAEVERAERPDRPELPERPGAPGDASPRTAPRPPLVEEEREA